MNPSGDTREELLLSGVFPERWLKVIPGLAQRVGATNMHCTLYDPHERRMAIDGFWSMGSVKVFPELARYLGCDFNPWLSAANRYPHGTWLATDDLVPRDELHRTDFYRDLIEPMNIEESLGLIIPGSQPYAFVFYRPRAYHRFPDALKGDLRGLVDTLSTAMELAESRRAWGGAFGCLQEGQATILVDGRMEVRESNRAALQLTPRDAVFLDGGRLCSAMPRILDSLRVVIDDLHGRNRPTGFTRTVHLLGPGARQTEVVGTTIRASRVWVALMIRDQLSQLRGRIVQLSRRLAAPLTDAQVEVAVHMCAGASLCELARLRNRSAEKTIIKHFANINKKLGCHSRHEATAILLGLRDPSDEVLLT